MIFLHLLSNQLIAIYTCLINRSFANGIFPNELKISRIVTIFKYRDCAVNYRPISIRTFFAKVFKKLLYKYLLDFLEDNNDF